MDTNLPALPPSPESSPAIVPPPEPASDPATAAFSRLEMEIGVLRRLIDSIDPSPTLAGLQKDMNAMRRATNELAGRPAMKLTPGMLAREIAAAGKAARAADSATIVQARDRIDTAAARMEHLAGTVAAIRDQRRRLWWAGGIGVVAGILLWSAFPGFVARALPDGWHLPERMAARTLDLERWGAGERLLATTEPEHSRAVLFSYALVQDNRDAIGKCREAAAKTKKPVRCAVEIRPEP